MNSQETKKELHVQMFESFCIRNGEKALAGGKTKDVQFVRLMQMVLHHAEQGVQKRELAEYILGKSETEYSDEAIQTVISRAEHKLKRMGFEEDRFFLQEDGIYRFTPEILVTEDAAEFERLCRKAQKEADASRKYSMLKKACHIYKGEFLAEYVGTKWIEDEARRYRELYRHCVCQKEKLLLKVIQDNITEKEQDIKGGYLCSYQAFQGIYQLLCRMRERNRQDMVLMLCTAVDKYGVPIKKDRELQELNEALGDAICRSVRHGDIVGRYGMGRYIILLAGTIREHCILVQERIDQNFTAGEPYEAGLMYQILPVGKNHA